MSVIAIRRSAPPTFQFNGLGGLGLPRKGKRDARQQDRRDDRTVRQANRRTGVVAPGTPAYNELSNQWRAARTQWLTSYGVLVGRIKAATSRQHYQKAGQKLQSDMDAWMTSSFFAGKAHAGTVTAKIRFYVRDGKKLYDKAVKVYEREQQQGQQVAAGGQPPATYTTPAAAEYNNPEYTYFDETAPEDRDIQRQEEAAAMALRDEFVRQTTAPVPTYQPPMDTAFPPGMGPDMAAADTAFQDAQGSTVPGASETVLLDNAQPVTVLPATESAGPLGVAWWMWGLGAVVLVGGAYALRGD